MGTLWSDVITRRERHRKPRDEGKMKRSHLPTKISAKDRAKQFPGLLHDSGGKLFCTPCNCVLDHRRKSGLENHFASAKHARMVKAAAEAAKKQLTYTEASTSKIVARAERIKVSSPQD